MISWCRVTACGSDGSWQLLRQAAENTQLVVFTCKPEDYLGDDDDNARVRGIDLVGLVKRI